jgi:hypothetical protein
MGALSPRRGPRLLVEEQEADRRPAGKWAIVGGRNRPRRGGDGQDPVMEESMTTTENTNDIHSRVICLIIAAIRAEEREWRTPRHSSGEYGIAPVNVASTGMPIVLVGRWPSHEPNGEPLEDAAEGTAKAGGETNVGSRKTVRRKATPAAGEKGARMCGRPIPPQLTLRNRPGRGGGPLRSTPPPRSPIITEDRLRHHQYRGSLLLQRSASDDGMDADSVEIVPIGSSGITRRPS